jgi:hypothetical protein
MFIIRPKMQLHYKIVVGQPILCMMMIIHYKRVVQLASLQPTLHWQMPGMEHDAVLNWQPTLHVGIVQLTPFHPDWHALQRSPPQLPEQIHSSGNVQ